MTPRQWLYLFILVAILVIARLAHSDDLRTLTLRPSPQQLSYAVSPINLFASGEWMAYRHDAPVAPQTTVRFGMTIAFPQWRPC
jgi:hypothetical protein